MAKKIRLSTDYQCWPLWWEEADEVGDIDPKTLPLRPETIAGLERWAETFDSWMDLDDPASEQEPSDEEFQAFEQDGVRLWKQLQQELAPDYEVIYRSKRLGKVLQNRDEPSRRTPPVPP